MALEIDGKTLARFPRLSSVVRHIRTMKEFIIFFPIATCVAGTIFLLTLLVCNTIKSEKYSVAGISALFSVIAHIQFCSISYGDGYKRISMLERFSPMFVIYSVSLFLCLTICFRYHKLRLLAIPYSLAGGLAATICYFVVNFVLIILYYFVGVVESS